MEAFGMRVEQIDGNDPAVFIEAIESLPKGDRKPKAVIAQTVKGKGVSFIEGQPSWHHRIPKGEELPQAMEELI